MVLAAAVLGGAGPQGPQGPTEAARLYQQYPDGQFTPLFKESLETWVTAEAAYRGGRYGEARGVLDEFWTNHPAGAPDWKAAYQEAAEATAKTGINLGHPACYYALRMLTECVEWRTSGKKPAHAPITATMTIVLVGKAQGIQPRTRAEMEAGKGIEASRDLDQRLLADDHQLIKESTWLFTEYVRAATEGQLEVKIDYVNLPKLVVPTSVTWDQRGHAGLANGAWGAIWDAVPEAQRRRTDWWWVLYPSAVPDRHPDFATTEFVTGGMGTGPDGQSPCFIIDDKWLVRKPPHLGRGDYSSLERRAYLPQWFQHEFFHHLYRIYPEFGLEKQGHDWFNRSTWPPDFQGELEPDYYAESLKRRFKGSSPSLAFRLLYAPPSPDLFAQIKTEDVLGEYVHEPVQNDWHRGRITRDESGQLWWQNQAGKKWRLTLDKPAGALRTFEDNPYYSSPQSRNFNLVLERDPATARYLPSIRGFSFSGSLYAKVEKAK